MASIKKTHKAFFQFTWKWLEDDFLLRLKKRRLVIQDSGKINTDESATAIMLAWPLGSNALAPRILLVR